MKNPLYVKVDQKLIHEYYEGVQYGNWKKEYKTKVVDVFLDRYLNEHSGEEEFPCDATVGDDVYVVSVIYGSGDSFGTASGYICIIGVYNNNKDAYMVLDKITEFKNRGNVTVHLSDGTSQTLYWPAGYFEYVQEINVDVLKVKEKDDA